MSGSKYQARFLFYSLILFWIHCFHQIGYYFLHFVAASLNRNANQKDLIFINKGVSKIYEYILR
jgi:hypothetical protein